MTETKEIKTAAINTMTITEHAGQQVLLIGLREPYQDKPQYTRSLIRGYAKSHEYVHPNILKFLDEKVIEGYGHCVILEWEPARSLFDYMSEQHTEEEKKDVIRQLWKSHIPTRQSFRTELSSRMHAYLLPTCTSRGT